MSTYVAPDVPEWVGYYATDIRRLLGIHDDWRIWLRFSDRPHGSENSDATTMLTTPYLKAEIEVRRGLDSEARMRYVIMHELFHVALAPIDLASQQIRDLLPENLRKFAEDLHSDAQEQVIERMTRAIQAYGGTDKDE